MLDRCRAAVQRASALGRDSPCSLQPPAMEHKLETLREPGHLIAVRIDEYLGDCRLIWMFDVTIEEESPLAPCFALGEPAGMCGRCLVCCFRSDLFSLCSRRTLC